MGIPERKEREKQELRDLILKEARALILEVGFENSSWRNIAERIEYSPTTIYLYFKDKNELFLALHEESFQRFFSALSSVAYVPDPFERLTALGRAYIEYGINNPEEYDLKFLLKAPLEALQFRHEVWCDGLKAFELVKSMVQDCKDHGYFKPDLSVEATATMLWAQVHGLVTLYLRDRLEMFENKDIKRIVEESYDAFIKFLKCYR
jgi:AcrR family transcriptional regulator